MTTPDRVALAVAALGSTVSAVWALVSIRDVLALLDKSGGLFGDSNDVLKNVLPFLLTVWLFRRVRNIDRASQLLRRCYVIAMVTTFAVFAAMVPKVVWNNDLLGERLSWTLFESTLLAGGVWLPMQLFFAAGFVALLIRRRPVVA